MNSYSARQKAVHLWKVRDFKWRERKSIAEELEKRNKEYDWKDLFKFYLKPDQTYKKVKSYLLNGVEVEYGHLLNEQEGLEAHRFTIMRKLYDKVVLTADDILQVEAAISKGNKWSSLSLSATKFFQKRPVYKEKKVVIKQVPLVKITNTKRFGSPKTVVLEWSTWEKILRKVKKKTEKDLDF